MSIVVKSEYDIGDVHFVELGDSREGVVPTKSFYISLVRDLNGCYLRVQAQSIRAVEQYLQRNYLTKQGVWKLPWCAVYATEPTKPQFTRGGGAPIIIDAIEAGVLFEDEEEI